MRTPAEIVSRIRSLENTDFFGFQTSDLIAYLPFEHAKEFLKPEVTSADWAPKPSGDMDVVADMLSYMEFAWGKANDNRGLSAARSLNHMQAWLWMLGEDGAAGSMENYAYYGKPQLRAICDHFGWDWSVWDDGRWTNDEMSSGTTPDEVDTLELPWLAVDA